MNTYVYYKGAGRVADERDRLVGDRLTVALLWQHLPRFEHRQVPPFQPILPQMGEGLAAFDAEGPPEGGYLAMFEATEVLPQEWDVETITYESVPLISYTPRTFVIDVCFHIKGYMLMKKLDFFTNFQ